MEGKFDKKIRPQREREIYKPGSGPLRRTDPFETKTYVNKNDTFVKSNQLRNDKNTYDISNNSNVSDGAVVVDITHEESFTGRDKQRKSRKPDAGIYVPKQRSKTESSHEYENSPYPHSVGELVADKNVPKKERSIGKDTEYDRQRHDNGANYPPNRQYVENKQYFRGSKIDLKEEFDTYDDRNTQQSYPMEYKNSSFYNRYDRNDRGGNTGDKNRGGGGRNLPRRNSSNALVLPDAFHTWPPRLQRQFLETKGIKPEELDKYLKNRNNFGGNGNRDSRYSQSSQPPKNNRMSHFKSNKSKENVKSAHPFQKLSKYNENFDSDQSHHSQEKLNVAYKETATADVSSGDKGGWHSNEKVEEERTETAKNTVSKSERKTSDDRTSNLIEGKDLLEDSDEVFNWAEEVEREQQIAEKNNSKSEEHRKYNDASLSDEKKDKKKRRSFSYERNQPQKNDGENCMRRRDEDSDRNEYHSRGNDSSNNDGSYLSWRRNKNPSPSRTRLGIMTRNHRVDNKYDNLRHMSGEQERINHKIKINNRITDLPAVVRDQMNSSSEKESVAGIIKLPVGGGPNDPHRTDAKCPPPVFPAPQFPTYPKQPIKQLYNPTNPKQPIIVSSQSARGAAGPPAQSATSLPPHYSPPSASEHPSQAFVPSYMDPGVSAIVAPPYSTDQYMMSRPAWYDAYSLSFRSTNHAHLLLDINRADLDLQALLSPVTVIHAWDRITALRSYLQEALKTLLTSDLKFCETENVEQHMWKILFYNVIELLRKCMVEDTYNLQKYKSLLYSVIDKGMEYFRNLLALLERTYKIKIDDYLLVETPSTKALGYGGLALISAQKIFLFLGDLARYKETTEESCTYTNARQWYVKANQLNPRNGRPYNQLAILAVYGKKKFDAVYYYMRSLMASNPFFTARDSLLALFDDNRKKYEQVEKIRRELKEKRKQEKAREKESVFNGSLLRKETWIRPDDGRKVQRTTSTSQECHEENDDDELVKLPAAEVNKRFLLSFLHVHGKLFSKVGMETLQEAAVEMLKEFRVLLNHSPLPINTNRLVQLLALNMFAIDNGQLKDPQIESGYHSAVQESALVISLQMFNLIINRCIQLLREQLQRMKSHPDQIDWHYPLVVSADAQILLPAIKLWCDWLFCHSIVWNPPPSCQDYRISGCGDCWSRLAVLINILEELDYQEIVRKNNVKDPILIMSDERNDRPAVKINLDEDVALRGFTPLMCNDQPPVYTRKDVDMELAQICLRIHRILFFGTIYLCGIDPPVLKLHKTETGSSEYISVVEEVTSPRNQSDNENACEQQSENEVDDNNDSGNELEVKNKAENSNLSEESLLYRKKELERIHQKREKYMRDKKETINKDIAAFNVEMEIKPHYLVPDTNCFIDSLTELEKIVKATSATTQRPLYSLMVPVIVLSELEGIARGIHKDSSVTEKARYALSFLQNRSSYSNIKCVTTRGSVLSSARFTSEEDYSKVDKNDDKILTTCLNLCKHNGPSDGSSDQPKKIYREVVLMTEDRNLRVKALSSNMPVQSVSDFIQWAGL